MGAATVSREGRRSPAAAAAGGGPRFRADVEGLRAVAIVMVVGYHVGLPGFDGGFVGVDVFFVISGFVITASLLAEHRDEGRIALGAFWARRIRRLVPALALVVAATLLVGRAVLPLYEHESLGHQGMAAALYVSNLTFATQSQDYFAADLEASPLLHTWSLGLEEQFYLLWPLLIALIAGATARRGAEGSTRARRRAPIAAALAVVAAASYLHGTSLAADGSPWAFFGLPSRLWELAAGGLVAVALTGDGPPAPIRGAALRWGITIGGVLALVGATTLIDDTTLHPGPATLAPVLGTLALVAVGERATSIHRGLATRPCRWLGRTSYAWYLWHWPAIVLVGVALDDDSTAVAAAAAAAALALAAATHRVVEAPLRSSPPLVRSRAATFATGAVLTLAVVLLASTVVPDLPDATDPSGATTAAGTTGEAGTPATELALEERVAVSMAEFRDRTFDSCPIGGVETARGDAYCTDGDPDGEQTVLLLGDSHAGQWRQPLARVARERGVRLVIRQHNGCPPARLEVTEPGDPTGDRTDFCRDAQQGSIRLLDDLDPDAVVISTWSGYQGYLRRADGSQPEPQEEVEMWASANAALYAEIAARELPLGVVLDAPTLPFEASECLAAEGAVAACEPDRASATARSSGFLAAERALLAEHPDAEVIDLIEHICDEDRCRLEIDGTLVYVDSHHLTGAFTAGFEPELERLLARLLDDADR